MLIKKYTKIHCIAIERLLEYVKENKFDLFRAVKVSIPLNGIGVSSKKENGEAQIALVVLYNVLRRTLIGRY